MAMRLVRERLRRVTRWSHKGHSERLWTVQENVSTKKAIVDQYVFVVG